MLPSTRTQLLNIFHYFAPYRNRGGSYLVRQDVQGMDGATIKGNEDGTIDVTGMPIISTNGLNSAPGGPFEAIYNAASEGVTAGEKVYDLTKEVKSNKLQKRREIFQGRKQTGLTYEGSPQGEHYLEINHDTGETKEIR